MDLRFRLVDAGTTPDHVTAADFKAAWPSYKRWFLSDGEQHRATYVESRNAIKQHMPELLADFDALVEVVGGGDLEARFLSHWCPPPLVAACSIAVTGDASPLLVRTYDYPPTLCSLTAMRSNWSGRRVLGMMDCAWGLMDGINDAGLSIAIAFGGRKQVGVGFGIGLIVRYLLQTCDSVAQAVEKLRALPVQMSYNVALLDESGAHAIARVSPDRALDVVDALSCANRQGPTEWPEHAAYCSTVEREEALTQLQSLPGGTVVQAFLAPPLARSLAETTWGTAYTASYSPIERAMSLLWPDDTWHMHLHSSDAGERVRHERVLYPNGVMLDARDDSPAQISIVR